jgi:hypothetical protein
MMGHRLTHGFHVFQAMLQLAPAGREASRERCAVLSGTAEKDIHDSVKNIST